ncbi:hypothetical protein HFP51_03475 [Parasphingopyxis sp. CP4]|uniref:hypothetical protein n=1 Tax=Parasphingopyxis sp. CP4 TaxID=2724527 RepID=UPI0015A45F41|nr:hypothetical protein [Parasphingopyxis sp. CP4]QLC21325.1 hypothetical protein HFP51_03475 [Parasphingopyxis sp. CP4]
MAESDNSIEVLDSSEETAFASAFSAHIAKEQAGYVQVTGHAIEDFPASVSLILEHLVEGTPQAVATTMLAVSRYRTEMPDGSAAVAPRNVWLRTSQVRSQLSEMTATSPASVLDAIEAIIGELTIEPLPLVSGAFYLTQAEQAELVGAARSAAEWRARAAESAAEVDRLLSEKRVRAGREAALRARHDRDLARQVERTRAEIERLHRAAGWAGRWRARFARMFGGK